MLLSPFWTLISNFRKTKINSWNMLVDVVAAAVVYGLFFICPFFSPISQIHNSNNALKHECHNRSRKHTPTHTKIEEYIGPHTHTHPHTYSDNSCIRKMTIMISMSHLPQINWHTSVLSGFRQSTHPHKHPYIHTRTWPVPFSAIASHIRFIRNKMPTVCMCVHIGQIWTRWGLRY